MGSKVCEEKEECGWFFILLSGSVLVEEQRVSHTEELGRVAVSKRHTMTGAARPSATRRAIQDSILVGYTAKVVDSRRRTGALRVEGGLHPRAHGVKT